MAPEQERVVRDALKLPPEARAALAATLIDSLDTEVDEEASEEWSREIAKRDAEIRQSPAKVIPWSEARRRIQGK